MLYFIKNYPIFLLKILIRFIILKCIRRSLPNSEIIFSWDRQFFKGNPNQDRLIETLYIRGWHEFFTSAVMDKYIKNGMTVLDVGAHLGWSTLFMARRVGPNGRVLAFEPSEVLMPQLMENIKINDYQNIEIYKKALTGKDQNIEIEHSKVNCLQNSSKVPSQTFDTFYRKSNIKKINFVKIDIEGFEMDCLIGMSNFIKNEKPIITIEVHGSFLKEFSYNSNDVIIFLENSSYKIFYSTKMTKNEMLSSDKHFHILAIPL